MAAKQFTHDEWNNINALLDDSPVKYGFPERVYGSVLIGSFNIRKLGSSRRRNADTWNFLARICKQFDLIAIQEVMDDLSGMRRLIDLIGPEFGLVVSDKTGVFPGAAGLGERLGFIFRWSVVKRGEVASDISYDRSKVLEIMAHNYEDIDTIMQPYSEKLLRYIDDKSKYDAGTITTKPSKPRNPKMPVFLSFIRQPFCVSFKIVGFPGTKPYEFMAVNAHLFFGDYMSDRRQEFNALMEWIIARVKQNSKAYYPNFMLLGDLNLDFDKPEIDRGRIENYLKSFDDATGKNVSVNFPFLDIHPNQSGQFRTNARLGETFDQIGLFFEEEGLPTYADNAIMGSSQMGPDYGVFNFTELFRDALGITTKVNSMSNAQKKSFFSRFEHKVSDHLPLWLRLPLPYQ